MEIKKNTTNFSILEKVAQAHLALRSKELSLFHNHTKTNVPKPG